MRNTKHFVGRKLRNLREGLAFSQAEFAERLGISTSYLNQIENNQRPITATVLLALAENFDVDITDFSTNDRDRVVADLREALSDPAFAGDEVSLQSLKLVADNAPDIAHALLTVHRAYRSTTDTLAQLDASMNTGALTPTPTPYEEVRDFFHYTDNYIDQLDTLAEACAGKIAEYGRNDKGSLIGYLSDVHGIGVVKQEPEDDAANMVRFFDPGKRILTLGAASPVHTDSFQLAHQIGLLECSAEIDAIVSAAAFKTEPANGICRIGLANYFAGALRLPYSTFIHAAGKTRHDLERLAQTFAASIEQVAHRLSTLQRPGNKGVPFFFVRVDQAGNITKRHSATKLQFARFGASCPLWNVHAAFQNQDTFSRQLAETPDGARYISIARQITKHGGAFNQPTRRFAIALGCEVKYAERIVYADDLDVQNARAFTPIGVSCRICDRTECTQRAVPPISKSIRTEPERRDIVPYFIG